MKRAQFSVVTGVTTILTVLALLRISFQGQIPPLKANSLANQPGEYLERAVHQAIQWQPFNREAFVQARRESKPTLLVIGAPWSRLARFVDKQSFGNEDIASVINENFVPVRVDVTQQPQWLSTFLPLSRLRSTFFSGFQAWVLDTHGRLLTLVGGDSPYTSLDHNQILQHLIDAKKLFADAELTDVIPDFSERQHSDVVALQQTLSGGLPDFQAYSDALRNHTDLKGGGFTEANSVTLRPLAWLYQLRTGGRAELRESLDPILISPLVDILRGGFFRNRYITPPFNTDFDEPSVINAQMAQVLAEASESLTDPTYRLMAERTFDMILRDLRKDGLFVACREGDDQPNGRSMSASFSPRRLRGLLDGSDAEWARNNLGLRVETNPQMVPYPVSRDVLDDIRLESILNKLRSSDASVLSPPLDGIGCLDVNGDTAACLLRCARLWGDRERLNQVLDVSDQLNGFRFESNDVVHVKSTTSPGTYLGDYLAYSDAMLQDYLATGRVMSFDNGLAVLERALDLFRGEQPGVFVMALATPNSLGPLDATVPEIADDVRESCTAQLTRLACDYGRLLGPTAVGQGLRKTASDAVIHFSQLPVPPTPRLAGYYCAAATFEDPQCAFAVGPNSQELADNLARLRPNRLVAAAFGSVRPDLQSRKPGIYVVSSSIVAGPYSLEEAARIMPKALQLGLAQP